MEEIVYTAYAQRKFWLRPHWRLRGYYRQVQHSREMREANRAFNLEDEHGAQIHKKRNDYRTEKVYLRRQPHQAAKHLGWVRAQQQAFAAAGLF